MGMIAKHSQRVFLFILKQFVVRKAPLIEEALYNWFVNASSRMIPLSNAVLKAIYRYIDVYLTERLHKRPTNFFSWSCDINQMDNIMPLMTLETENLRGGLKQKSGIFTAYKI
ncbi:hypothetical protein BpHYR1_008050 [Brachionus plicatilis]|uniref:Uncharacterized protein n=1 Tax=Brachionus plicatilis TaxID=10195 RepID=A0A3M7T309_BRAPC|nr:hypothetical protein BpHYR1_008050 [Brachionus plicatilis]